MQQQLRRNRKDKLLCGVLSGIADYLGIGILITRIVFIILCFINWGFVFGYILLAILLPEEPLEVNDTKMNHDNKNYNSDYESTQDKDDLTSAQWKISLKNSNVFFASLCIVVGVFSLFFRDSEIFSFSSIGALIVIVTGFYLFSKNIIISTSEEAPPVKAYANRRMIVGITLMVLGILWMLSIAKIVFIKLSSIILSVSHLWPVLLIGLGLNFLIKDKKTVKYIWIAAVIIVVLYSFYISSPIKF